MPYAYETLSWIGLIDRGLDLSGYKAMSYGSHRKLCKGSKSRWDQKLS